MAIAVLTSNETGANSLIDINANFADLDTTKADLASPTFTGTPTLPTGTIATTQSPGDSSTKVATTAYVDAVIGSGQSTSGIASKDLSEASNVQQIAHGLGIVPKKVRLTLLETVDSANQVAQSIGVFDSSGNHSVGNIHETDGTPSALSWNSSVFAIGIPMGFSIPATQGQTGIVSVDATNIIITWTKNLTPSGTESFLWEAE